MECKNCKRSECCSVCKLILFGEGGKDDGN